MQDGIKDGIWKRPKCVSPNCNEGGLVLISGHLFCGKCIAERKKQNDKLILESLGIIE
jgi:hypothetical protein